jgi:predicted dehydrogenase
MLRVAIIGCGKIADQHAAQIARIKNCRLVAVCDREPLMAQQLAERYGGVAAYDTVNELLERCAPDVVHVTTPPESHFDIATRCLNAGCHVYVEKPLTLYAWEAAELLARAVKFRRQITVGHNVQFSPEMLAVRQAVREGFLGGDPIHIESVFSYQLGDADYVKALLADKSHWVRQLPGKLLQNIISHGVAKIAEFLVETGKPLVIARGFCSPALHSQGEEELFDELRVVMLSGQTTTAYFTFTTQLGPSIQELRVFGPQGCLIADSQHRTVLKTNRHSSEYRSYLNFFVPPIKVANQLYAGAARNIKRFVAADFHMDAGLKNLIGAFYDAVRGVAPPPFSHAEMLLTSEIMDEIFVQLSGLTRDATPRALAVRRAAHD